MNRVRTPSTAVDALKAIASQLIVLHHLAAYGPVARAMRAGAPVLVDWLYDYARMAVQVFLVVGGYLAAQALGARPGAIADSPVRAIAGRYLRLAVPFVAALALVVAAAAIARVWIGEDFVPGAPAVGQLLAHTLLAHELLDQEALSAGVWYVAIDFQLFVLLALIVWAGRAVSPATSGPPPLAMLLVAALAIASLFAFNRDAGLDDWAIYFFGAYAMGVTLRWAQDSRRPAPWIAAIAMVAVAALAFDFRWRIAVALATVLVLAAARLPAASAGSTAVGALAPAAGARRPFLPRALGGALRGLAQISYALFLVHFAVILVAAAAFEALGARSPMAGFVTALAVWAASLLLAAALNRWVEAPSQRLRRAVAGDARAGRGQQRPAAPLSPGR